MATQTKTATPPIDAFTERMREAGEQYLDVTAKTFNGLADLQIKLADATKLEWATAVATANADITRDLVRAYVDGARGLLAAK